MLDFALRALRGTCDNDSPQVRAIALCKEGRNRFYRACARTSPKLVTNEDVPGSLGGESAKVRFSGQWHQMHKVWLGRGWCDRGPRGKGGLQERGLPRVWHPLTLFVFPS